MTRPAINYAEQLSKRQYIPGFKPPADSVIFKIQNEAIGSLQSFIVFSGLPKSGKSSFLTAALASVITGREVFGMQLIPIQDRPKIAYFDTESSIFDFYSHMDRLKRFADISELPEYIMPYHTREDGPGMQKALINQHIKEHPDTSIIFIDGLLDMCLNYNDEKETRELIIWLKKMTTKHNILMICVLHTGKDGSQRLGHLGANTDRWAQSTLTVKKEDGKFLLEPKFLRSSGGFVPIELEYSKELRMLIQVNTGETTSKQHWKFYTEDQHFEKIDKIFQQQSSFTYDDFIQAIKNIECRGINYCKEYFSLMKKNEWIRQNHEQKWLDSRKIF